MPLNLSLFCKAVSSFDGWLLILSRLLMQDRNVVHFCQIVQIADRQTNEQRTQLWTYTQSVIFEETSVDILSMYSISARTFYIRLDYERRISSFAYFCAIISPRIQILFNYSESALITRFLDLRPCETALVV